jgi:hypothetical protein
MPVLMLLLHDCATLALGDGVGPVVSASGGGVEGDGEQSEAGTSAERSQRRGGSVAGRPRRVAPSPPPQAWTSADRQEAVLCLDFARMEIGKGVSREENSAWEKIR